MIPVSTPFIAKNTAKYLRECADSGWYSSHGPFVERFEKAFSEYLGVKYALTTTSGTASLHLALSAFGIGAGDEILVPDFTMISPVAAVIYTGAKPVFVDADTESWTMDVNLLENKVTKRTKGIIATAIYGHPADFDPIKKLAKKYGLFIVEDAAEGLGSEYKGKLVGSMGDISCFSFYANKLVTTGEGGMVTTHDKKLFERLIKLADMCHSDTKRFLHEDIGYTYRMSALQAALGLSQLEEIKQSLAKKRGMAALYTELLMSVKGLTLPAEKPWAKNSFWMYGILVNDAFGMSRDELRGKLREKGIETRDFFVPMHKQPALIHRGLVPKETFPVSDDLGNRGLYLPSGIGITEKQISFIAQTIQSIAGFV
jgi:perosamine synthetase